jgi:hypothetical protein
MGQRDQTLSLDIVCLVEVGQRSGPFPGISQTLMRMTGMTPGQYPAMMTYLHRSA